MQFFFRNCTHILTGTQGKTFEDMFLVKIANEGTSLKFLTFDLLLLFLLFCIQGVPRKGLTF